MKFALATTLAICCAASTSNAFIPFAIVEHGAPCLFMHSRETDDDRFSLTEWERQTVTCLQDACLEEGIECKSIFELAKYVLAARSSAKDGDPKADQKRLKIALKRIKKRRRWEARHGMADIDPMDAFDELLKSDPDYFVSDYIRDKGGLSIVGHHLAFAPTDFMFASKENKEKYLAAEQLRFDLAAPDMEEARRGIAIICVAEGKLTISRAYRYLRMLSVGRENLLDIHSHRILRVYSEVPAFLEYLIKPAKAMLPQNIAGRLVIRSKIADIEENIDEIYESRRNSEERSTRMREWVTNRYDRYQETVQQLQI